MLRQGAVTDMAPPVLCRSGGPRGCRLRARRHTAAWSSHPPCAATDPPARSGSGFCGSSPPRAGARSLDLLSARLRSPAQPERTARTGEGSAHSGAAPGSRVRSWTTGQGEQQQTSDAPILCSAKSPAEHNDAVVRGEGAVGTRLLWINQRLGRGTCKAMRNAPVRVKAERQSGPITTGNHGTSRP